MECVNQDSFKQTLELDEYIKLIHFMLKGREFMVGQFPS